MKKRCIVLFFILVILKPLWGGISEEILKIQPDILSLYLEYYSSQGISISYEQNVNANNAPIYYSKLFGIPLDAAQKKYPVDNYNLSVDLEFYNKVTYWKFAPISDLSNYKVIMTEGKDNIFFDNKGKFAIVDFLNYNTEPTIAKITDYLCKIPGYSQVNLPYAWKTYASALQDALNGNGGLKVLSHSGDEIVLELSLPFQRNLSYMVIIELRKVNGLYVPKKYYHKSSNDSNAISLWDVTCEYNLKHKEVMFPEKIVVNYHRYLENGERFTIKTDVFSNIKAKKIVLAKGEAFRPLKLPEGTILRFGEDDQNGVMIGNAIEVLKNKINN